MDKVTGDLKEYIEATDKQICTSVTDIPNEKLNISALITTMKKLRLCKLAMNKAFSNLIVLEVSYTTLMLILSGFFSTLLVKVIMSFMFGSGNIYGLLFAGNTMLQVVTMGGRVLMIFDKGQKSHEANHELLETLSEVYVKVIPGLTEEEKIEFKTEKKRFEHEFKEQHLKLSLSSWFF